MSETNQFGVFYTDGGCRPSRGFGGWGYHGYVYDGGTSKQGTGLKDWHITPVGYFHKDIIAEGDGTLSPNQLRLAMWEDLPELAPDPKIKNVNVINYYSGTGSLGNDSTNNVAEIVGATKALAQILELGLIKAHVYIDSRYALDGITGGIDEWKANGWRKPGDKDLPNVEWWRLLDIQKVALEAAGTEVIFRWVKGHVGNLGNEKADYTATCGVIMSKKNIDEEIVTVSPPQGYWSEKAKTDRMLGHRYMYFNTGASYVQSSPCGRHIYHIGDHGKDDEMLGKKMSDSSFGVLFLDKPNVVLEAVKREQNSLPNGGNDAIVVAKLDTILRPANYNEIDKTNGKFLYQRKTPFDLYNGMDIKLTNELTTPRIAWNVIDLMRIMETLLIQYIDDPIKGNIIATDITDEFYSTDSKGKLKFNPKITSAIKSLDIDVAYKLTDTLENKKITLTLGHDVLGRNNLSALTENAPIINVITWRESKHAFRYATIIKVGDSIGIYAGFYSNIILTN